MPVQAQLTPLSRRDPDVVRIAHAWRRLTSDRSRRSGRSLGSGEPTLLACSGGVDSSALAFAFATVTRHIVIAHVVHDMRPREQALADRDAVARLASRLGLPFVEAAISVRDADRSSCPNLERVARVRRYEALRTLALAHSLSYVAVAHQAQDQIETLLMRLVRGSGPQGLRGIAPKRALRPLSPDPALPNIWLIRPMLRVSREDAERLCRACDWTWQEDATNRDTSRLRSGVRHLVIPELRARNPRLDDRIAATADLMRDATQLVRARARSASRTALIPSDESAQKSTPDLAWSRAPLRRERAIVLGEILRTAITRLTHGSRRDRLSHEAVSRVADAIRDASRDPRRFTLGSVEITVLAERVEARKLHYE